MTATRTAPEISAWCRAYIGDALGISPDSIDVNREFDSLGLDSAVITSMLIELEEWLELDIPPSLFFSLGTLAAMADTLAERAARPAERL